MKNFSSDTVISGCVAEGNVESPGIWFDGSNTGVTIENCRCFRNGLGIMYEIGERAIIKNNVCYENSRQGHLHLQFRLLCDRQQPLLSQRHVRHRRDRRGARGRDWWETSETGYTPARDNVVWGNILMDNCYPGLAIKGWEGRPELIMPDERIKSNVGNVSDYNIFYRSAKRGIPFWWNWGAMNCWTLKEWQEKTGNDKHSILAEPLFKDAAGYDFHPADKSPAILFARPQMSVAMDFDGKRRSDNASAHRRSLRGRSEIPAGLPSRYGLAFGTMALDYVKPLPKELAALSDAMARELPLGKLPDGKTGFLLEGRTGDEREPASPLR